MRSKLRLRIGTRKSRLAMAQATEIREAVIKKYPAWRVELVPITTQGDRLLDVPIDVIEGTGVFLKEIEEALLKKEIDCAVHSMKDLPTEIHPELNIGVITRREDPRDVLIAHDCMLGELSAGACIGTGSNRRKYQLLSFRPDVQIKPIRGNVDTRIRKWQEGQCDALVLAMAGVKRIGLEHLISQIIPFEILLPAAGQGAIGVELRADNAQLLEHLLFLDDEETHTAIDAERAFLAEIGGGCRLPIGVYGMLQNHSLHLMGRIINEETMGVLEGKASGSIEDAVAIGKKLARNLLQQ